MILKLQTLTPLHIGDGTKLHSFDYVLHEGRFYRISQQQFERFLRESDAGSSEMKYSMAFVDWTADMEQKINEAEHRRSPDRRDKNQELAHLKREFNLLAFARKEKIDKQFADFLKRNVSYVTVDGRPKQEIRGFQRGGGSVAFIPGSSIKGSIRTALLYHFLTVHADDLKIEEMVRADLNKIAVEADKARRIKIKFSAEKYRKKFCSAIENEAFFCEMKTEKGVVRSGEAQGDLLRCLSVSDVEVPGGSLGVENVDLYLVKKTRNGRVAQKQSQSSAVEVVMSGTELQVRIDFYPQLLIELHRFNNGDNWVEIGQELHFKDWRRKAEYLFGLAEEDFNVALEGNTHEKACQYLADKALAHILKCVGEFSKAQEKAYEEWATTFARPEYQGGEDAKKVTAGSKSIGLPGFKLRLGYATGFEGTTEVLYFISRHKNLFAEVMDVFGIGDNPGAWKNRMPGETYRANPDEFPKSRRLITGEKIASPPGWLTDAGVNIKMSQNAPVVSDAEPVKPGYPKGTLKVGTELDAELLSPGNPGRFRLFVRPGNEPGIDIKYPAGFKPDDIGRIALVRVKNIKGKDEITAVEFVRFK